jgi:hypothetical protein
MSFATYSGPIRSGTVSNTTGTTAGLIRNTGVIQLVQSVTLGFASINASLTGTAFVLPAGAILHSLTWFTTTTFTGGTATVKLSIGATDLVAATTVTGPANPTAMTGATAADATTALWANVGSTDAIITYTATKSATLTAGSVTLVCVYAQRAPDGSSAPVSV